MRPVSLAVAAIAAFLPAQIADVPVVDHPVSIDSGYLPNSAASAAVVWQQDVTMGNGDWLQLHFRDTNLPAGSRLRIASTGDLAAAQWHDAHSLRDYQFWSCQFSGPVLRLELHAAAGSSGNRVLVDVVREHLVSVVASQDTICGPTDDRVLSNDPRACRINSSCTGWLFGVYAVGTAGHCMDPTTSGQILHFNVPLSTSSGSTQPAHPNNQYAQEAFHPFLNGGIGNDWSVSAAVRNSNTGLFPGQAQGSWYHVTAAPAAITGVTIRITGYGTGNGTSGSNTWNQVQKTHTGPRASTSTANALSYVTDTTGGNSGSPVIYEQTGDVIGVHTHSGCTASSGANSGTNAVRTDWTSARAQVMTLHTAGEYTTFGTGCGGAAGVPVIAFSGIPETGRTVTVRATTLHAQAGFGAFFLGFSNTQWGSNPLPMVLDGFGLQGCQMLVDPVFTRAAAPAAGQASMALAVPSSAAFVGMTTYYQYACLDATAPNTAGAVLSNGGRLFIGN